MITIGRWQIRSKDVARQWCRRILLRLANNNSAANDEEFIRALLDRHPKRDVKIGSGIARFEARPNLTGDLEFWIVRSDGTETDFSFHKCLDGSQHRADVLAAMRAAISYQVVEARDIAFAQASTLLSPYLQQPMTAETCHMNHFPPFVDIAGRFVVMHGGYDAIKVLSGDGEHGGHLADEAIEQGWQEFHRRNAHLEPVSVEENHGICEQINATWRLDMKRYDTDRKTHRGYDVNCQHPEHRAFLQRNNRRCPCLYA